MQEMTNEDYARSLKVSQLIGRAQARVSIAAALAAGWYAEQQGLTAYDIRTVLADADALLEANGEMLRESLAAENLDAEYQRLVEGARSVGQA